jgi:hypothetical protein
MPGIVCPSLDTICIGRSPLAEFSVTGPKDQYGSAMPFGCSCRGRRGAWCCSSRDPARSVGEPAWAVFWLSQWKRDGFIA